MPIERPLAGGDVALDDDNLARIGLIVTYEAIAKSVAVSALRALAGLSEADWREADKQQFKQIVDRLSPLVSKVADSKLSERFEEFTGALRVGQEARNVIVHAPWGHGPERFEGYDYRRSRLVREPDIREAVVKCADLKRSVNWFALRIGELIAAGVLLERERGPGMAINTRNGTVRL
jgi:hypothetical protein